MTDLEAGKISNAVVQPSSVVPNGTVIFYYNDGSIYKMVTTDVNEIGLEPKTKSAMF